MAARTLLRLLGTTAKTAKADRIITCRVDAGQPFASSRGRNFQVRIAAWKEEDGTRHADPIVLKRDVILPPTASLWALAMPAKSLCRVAIGPIEKRPYFYPTAPLLAFLGPCEDADFAAASEPLVSPRTVTDHELGTLASSAEFPRSFRGKITWHGRSVSVSIDDCNDMSGELIIRQLLRLREMRADAAALEAKARKTAADVLYPDYIGGGWYGDEVPLEIDDWQARLTLDSIDLYPDGDMILVFEDGDLFAGHLVEVHGNADGEFHDASLFG